MAKLCQISLWPTALKNDRYDKRKSVLAFSRDSLHITDLLNDLTYRGNLVTNARKVIIDIVNPDHFDGHKAELYGGILEFYWPVDLTNYLELNERERQKFIIRVVQKSLRWAYRKYHWTGDRISHYCRQVVQRNFQNDGLLYRGKRWQNKDRSCFAQLGLSFERECIRYYVQIYDKSSQASQRHIFLETPPREGPLYLCKYTINWSKAGRSITVRERTSGRKYTISNAT